ncbi:MAG TPA: HEAT repeat domain-containing protein [Candidatus Ozemobacteraceae bacterium]|nr:HEAT repeat domain-containing protein [Candidatus Ozemobacteraceae bacterium]
MASLESLISDLSAEDLSIRLYAILTLHDKRDEPGLTARLKAASEKETDPSLKLYLTWLADSGASVPDDASRSCISLLEQPEPDWVSVFYRLHRADRKSAAEILPHIRRLDPTRLPADLLPLLVRFYQRHGTKEDTPRLIAWCSDGNPIVMSLAIEALSRIQPDCLKGLLLPLLANPSPGIRSRAIRLLYRWYPDEAPHHLAEMLDSELVDDRRAALANAFFLPFDSIKLEILRFIIREESPLLLLQAGNLLIINPDPEVARVTASIAINATPEKAPVLRQILEQQVEFLVKAGIVKSSPAEELERLLGEAVRRRQSRHEQVEDPDRQAADLRKLVAENPDGAVQHLKRTFRPDLPASLLAATTEHLAILEPEFLRPHLPELLRSPHLAVQVAGLTALTRLSPVQAEKLLEQYLFSAVSQRRKTGFHVLSLLERAFAFPLMVRSFAREQEPDLLSWFAERLPRPLGEAGLVALVKESLLFPESHQARLPFLESLCVRERVSISELIARSSRNADFTLENVMVNRAEIVARVPAPAARPAPETAAPKKPDRATDVCVSSFRSCSALEKIALLLNVPTGGNPLEEHLDELQTSEKNEFVRFLIEALALRRALSGQAGFSPVDLLRKNLAKLHPNWIEVAAGLSSLHDRAARLAAPLIQGRKWSSWRSELLPVVLDFAGRSGLAHFSAPAAGLLKHPQAEVRYCAIRCLERINPEELGAAIPELMNDRSAEIVALLTSVKVCINAKLAGVISRPAPTAGHGLQMRLSAVPWVPYAVVACICIVAMFALLPSGDESGQPVLSLSVETAAPKEIARFAAVRKPPRTGEERVVFGRVEKVFENGIVIHSPAFQKKVLIRCGKRPLKLVNDHYNARVRITKTSNGLVESDLIDSNRK